MSISAAILRRTCAFLRDVARNPVPPANEVQLRAVTAADLADKLSRKRFKKVVALRPRPAPEKMTIGEIREACVARAGGNCECGCNRAFTANDPAELDHWLGGFGRRRQKESVETCWLLRKSCHLDRTRNWPSTEHWNALRKGFCARHGYEFQSHIEHAKLQRRRA